MTITEWYSEHGILPVAVQCGGPDDKEIFETKRKLFMIIKDKMKLDYNCEVKHFAIVYRVAGKYANWGEDKIERIRRDKIRKFISCDIVVGQETVEELNNNSISNFVCKSIRDALVVMINRIKKDKLPIDDLSLLSDYDICVTTFNKHN